MPVSGPSIWSAAGAREARPSRSVGASRFSRTGCAPSGHLVGVESVPDLVEQVYSQWRGVLLRVDEHDARRRAGVDARCRLHVEADGIAVVKRARLKPQLQRALRQRHEPAVDRLLHLTDGVSPLTHRRSRAGRRRGHEDRGNAEATPARSRRRPDRTMSRISPLALADDACQRLQLLLRVEFELRADLPRTRARGPWGGSEVDPDPCSGALTSRRHFFAVADLSESRSSTAIAAAVSDAVERFVEAVRRLRPPGWRSGSKRTFRRRP